MHGTPEAGPTPPMPLPTDRLRFAMPPMHEIAGRRAQAS